jgi:hypothetical protein
MLTMKRVGILAIASLLITSVVSADRLSAGGGQKRWGSDPMPRAGVCFFEDTNFRGRYFCVGPGEDMSRMPPGMNDKISSVRVVGNVEVMVFKDGRFKGPSGRFSTDVGDLRREGWNDQISSLRVTNVSVAWDRGRSPAWGREAMPREGACFYRDSEFRGDYFCVPRGTSYAMVPPGFNDRISSIRVLRAGGVLIFEDHDFGGRNVRVTSDVRDLRRGVWNDKISSIRVF